MIYSVDLVSGFLSVLAGSTSGYSGDGGDAINAKLNQPGGLAYDSTRNRLYISGRQSSFTTYKVDSNNVAIRMIDFGPLPVPMIINKISTVVGGVNGSPFGGVAGTTVPANGTDIGTPYGLALDEQTNMIYFEAYNMYAYNATNGSIYLISNDGNTDEESCTFDAANKQVYCTRGANRQMYKQSVVSPYTPGTILNQAQNYNPPY